MGMRYRASWDRIHPPVIFVHPPLVPVYPDSLAYTGKITPILCLVKGIILLNSGKNIKGDENV
jgi:hypothetical protein